ncbi:putative short-chain dehydrogenase/reductase family protein [Xylariomycetidae sp. FL0641]|nr:putative short-chain dehydrogenase/reductase family protein [Xylariomycetidae sp. FL0641]
MSFSITPEKEASFTQALYRQCFITPSPVSPEEADLTGSTAIVTGSNGGIGLECARQLCALGLTKLILAVRDEAKGRHARDQLLAAHATLQAAEVWPLDLHSYASVRALAARAAGLDRLDYAILNAGVARLAFHAVPGTGHEENVQVNCISTALLMISLLPALAAGGGGRPRPRPRPGRLVLVSSDAAGWARFPERHADPLLPALDHHPARFAPRDRYYTSKLLGQLALRELARRVPASAAVLVAATPGLVRGTALLRDLARGGTAAGLAARAVTRVLGYAPAVGARQLVDAAVRHADAEVHGQYLCAQVVKPMAPIVYRPEGPAIARRLWRELMHELAFAGVEQILAQYGRATPDSVTPE